ncbi:hypothetical protein SEA_LIBERTYBELL_49 [Streptomyces phage LibertyBell]|nr:hypothetical protein SEA_LIBERTYBELL_49 [Streptomyces phage LibertyBell]
MDPLDEHYLRWLYSQVADASIEKQELTFWDLFHVLYTTEFISLVSFDENRIEDAKALRREFVQDQRLTGVDPNWITIGCSLLELMVGMSRRLAFEGDGHPPYWFWFHLMVNLGLDGYNDRDGIDGAHLTETLDRVIYRNYEPNGRGGFFPLEEATRDQRGVELWYQLNAYLNERDNRRARGEKVL